ncbi:MAG: hypothetical protein ACR2P7_00030 [bacterium]
MKFKHFGYIRRHWRGETSLTLSFWVNFLLLYVALNYLERFTLPPYLRGESAVTAAVVGFFLIVRLVVYPWQVVGVIRACERSLKNHADRTWVFAAQGVVVLSIAATLAAAFSSYQSLLGYKQSLRAPPTAIETRYSLEVIAGAQTTGRLIHIRGPLEVGITRRVSELLDAHPQVRGVILDSGGGQIYEGRGLARLIREHKLATYSLEQCDSACATAFAAGVRRALGRGAQLGFHQYKNYAALPVVDIDAEQAKDRALFEAQGISAEFLQKIFSHPPHRMWRPDAAELLASGMVHETDFALE